MSRTHAKLAISVALIGLLPAVSVAAETPFSFSTGNPDGLMATATRPDAAPDRFVIETSRDGKRWEIIVEPDESAEILIVVTAYAVG